MINSTGIQEFYTSQIRSLMDISLELKEKINNSKTGLKRQIYTKKLVRNNKKCAHIVEKLGIYLERMEKKE